MRLKDNCDIVAFLNAVQKCKGEVLLSTKEGDRLNLKSLLSRYVFAVIAENRKLTQESRIDCGAEDLALLEDFIFIAQH